MAQIRLLCQPYSSSSSQCSCGGTEQQSESGNLLLGMCVDVAYFCFSSFFEEGIDVVLPSELVQ
eukprot:8637656-Prorocentrum_lima.AAC.1